MSRNMGKREHLRGRFWRKQNEGWQQKSPSEKQAEQSGTWQKPVEGLVPRELSRRPGTSGKSSSGPLHELRRPQVNSLHTCYVASIQLALQLVQEIEKDKSLPLKGPGNLLGTDLRCNGAHPLSPRLLFSELLSPPLYKGHTRACPGQAVLLRMFRKSESEVIHVQRALSLELNGTCSIMLRTHRDKYESARQFRGYGGVSSCRTQGSLSSLGVASFLQWFGLFIL